MSLLWVVERERGTREVSTANEEAKVYPHVANAVVGFIVVVGLELRAKCTFTQQDLSSLLFIDSRTTGPTSHCSQSSNLVSWLWLKGGRTLPSDSQG